METVDRYVFGLASRYCALAERTFGSRANVSGWASFSDHPLVGRFR